jgi:integrase
VARGRRRRGSGSFETLPSGKVRVWFSGGLGPNGKRVRQSKTFDTRNDAEWWLREAKRQGRAPDTGETVAEYLERWLQGKRKIRESTRLQYENHVRKHLIPELGAIPVSQLTRRHVEAFVADRERHVSKSTGRPLTPATVGKILTTLRSALESAVPRDLPDNVAAKVEPPRIDRKPVRAVSSEEIVRIRQAVSGTWLSPIVRFLFGSGLRIGEAVALNQGDVDWTLGTVHVHVTKTTPRTVRVSKDGLAALRTIKHWRIGKREPLFWSPKVNRAGHHDRLSRHSVSHALPRVLKDHGIAPMAAHGLRHAHATVGLERGTPIESIAAQLGHRNPTMTRNVYAHVTARLADEALDRLDEAVSDG